jgi:hypothetical protein
MGLNTGAGAALFIGATAPATQDAAGYAALTLVEIGNVDKIGGFGSTFAKVEFQPLKGVKQKLKGSQDSGTLSPSMANDDTDAGQVLLATAAADETNKLYPFQVIKQNGAKRFFMGRIFGLPETIDGADNVDMATPTIEICSKIIKVAAT